MRFYTLVYFFIALLLMGCGGSGSTSNSPSTMGNGSAVLTWTKPIENTNNSTLSDLEGFYVYYGSEESYLSDGLNFHPYFHFVDNNAFNDEIDCQNIDNGTRMTCTIDNLDEQTNWYFAVTAVNSQYIQSNRSDIACKQFSNSSCLI